MGDAETGSLDEGRITFERPHEDRQEEPRVRARDPVCGMDIDPAGAAARSEYRAVPFYFCSESCKRQFDDDPSLFVGR